MRRYAAIATACAMLVLAGCSENAVTTVQEMEMSVTETTAEETSSMQILEEEPVNVPAEEPEMTRQVYANAYIYTGKGRAKVELESNPSAGYTWQADSSDRKVLDITEDSYVPYEYENGQDGVVGLRVFEFEASAPGETEVKFTYSRSFEEGKILAEKTMRFRIYDDLSVSLISAVDPALAKEECLWEDAAAGESVPTEEELLRAKSAQQ